MHNILWKYLQVLRSPDEGGAAAPLPEPSGVDSSPAANGADGEFDLPLGDDDLDSVTIPDEGAGAIPAVSPAAPAVSVVPPQTAAPAPTAPTVPAVPPAPVPAAQVPQAGPQPSPAPAAQPAAAPAGEPAQDQSFLDQWSAAEGQIVNDLAQRFQLSAEDVELLQAQPEAVLPQMAARVLYQAIASVHRQLEEFGPRMVEQYVRQSDAYKKNENDFFSMHPGLKTMTEEQKASVGAIAKVYRQMNPNASRDDVMKSVGLLAHQKFGIPIPAVVPPAQPPARPGAKRTFQPAASAAPMGAIPGLGAQDDPWAGFTTPNSGDDEFP